jgi:hypothetical protein
VCIDLRRPAPPLARAQFEADRRAINITIKTEHDIY